MTKPKSDCCGDITSNTTNLDDAQFRYDILSNGKSLYAKGYREGYSDCKLLSQARPKEERMSEAIKCDRCGRFASDVDAFNIQGKRVLANIPSESYYHKEFDLCRECGESLNEQLRRWWEGGQK